MKIVHFKRGELIRFQNQDYTFDSAVDGQKIVAFNLSKMTREILNISEIQCLKAGEKNTDLAAVDPRDWETAKKRYDIIRPLIYSQKEKALYRKIAKEAKVHVATIYQWLGKFTKSGLVTSLLPERRGPKEGSIRLDQEIENIIKQAIEEHYLTIQRKSITKVHEEIVLQCRNKRLVPPHLNTLRKRIRFIPEYARTKKREGWREAEQEFTENQGTICAEFPLSAVQIDHTLLDIVLVDDVSRMPIGRPWITLAFDVYSRVVLGFYISFDPPGTLSTGLCIARACLTKEKWLMRLGVSLEWPYWGLPMVIHADNAKEFRGAVLRDTCKKYGIELHWRPVAKPNWGGHIERYMKVLADELKSLPGATFSNPVQRGNYDSDKKAAMNISELEKYLITYVCGNYHQKIHSTIQKAPDLQWKESIFGTPSTPGFGLPRLITDEEGFRMEFLPKEDRTINEYGVRIDGIHYFADVLRPFVNSRLPGKYRMRRKFIFRKDPRDISVVYFWDDDNKVHHSIPYRNTAHPPISLWELNATKRHLKERSLENYDEATIFSTITQLRSIVEASIKKTRSTRRQIQRKSMHQNVHLPLKDKSDFSQDSEEDLSKFKPFSQIEVK